MDSSRIGLDSTHVLSFAATTLICILLAADGKLPFTWMLSWRIPPWRNRVTLTPATSAAVAVTATPCPAGGDEATIACIGASKDFFVSRPIVHVGLPDVPSIRDKNPLPVGPLMINEDESLRLPSSLSSDVASCPRKMPDARTASPASSSVDRLLSSPKHVPMVVAQSTVMSFVFVAAATKAFDAGQPFNTIGDDDGDVIAIACSPVNFPPTKMCFLFDERASACACASSAPLRRLVADTK